MSAISSPRRPLCEIVELMRRIEDKNLRVEQIAPWLRDHALKEDIGIVDIGYKCTTLYKEVKPHAVENVGQ